MRREKNINFDVTIRRNDTDCLKYDFAKRRGKPEDVLPLWVADMDFRVSSLVLDEINRRMAHGIFGYTEPDESYVQALSDWMLKKHNWKIRDEQNALIENWIWQLESVN